MKGFLSKIRHYITHKDDVKSAIENNNHEATQRLRLDLLDLEDALKVRREQKAKDAA